MQSTGQASTQAVSFVPMQGSAITYAMCYFSQDLIHTTRQSENTNPVCINPNRGYNSACHSTPRPPNCKRCPPKYAKLSFQPRGLEPAFLDRKRTRLNSSHVS